jgi:hypothetical protein
MAGWPELIAELDRWHRAGRTAEFWWRDDDAIEPTPALERLLSLSDRHYVPLALAVVPAGIHPELARTIAPHRHVVPVQHGFRHANHAPEGTKAAELGGHRPTATVLAEIEAGHVLIRRLPRALPVLVPPWNRIDEAIHAALPPLGIRGLSTFGARPCGSPVRGLALVNTHMDIIAWRRGRCFAGDDQVLREAIEHLAAKRMGDADGTEPTGLLTHHLVHDAAGWEFVEHFFAVTRGHRATAWRSPADLFWARP